VTKHTARARGFQIVRMRDDDLRSGVARMERSEIQGALERPTRLPLRSMQATLLRLAAATNSDLILRSLREAEASRRMAKGERVPAAVLRDASRRDASQDEGSVCCAAAPEQAHRRIVA
jgi:hypothetical protein